MSVRKPIGFSHPWASLYRDGRVANMRVYVGATPGDEWSQGGGGWEGGGGSQPASPSGGPTQVQISALQQSVADLKNQVDGVVKYMDPATDAASQQAVKTLQSNVNALSTSVSLLTAGTQNAFVNYPVLLIKYNGLKAEFDSYGLEAVVEPAAPAAPSQGKPSATPAQTVPVKPAATPDAPVIVTGPTPANNTVPWVLLLGGGLFALAALYFARKAI